MSALATPTNYTNYTAYTDYTIAKGKEVENRIPTLLIRSINRRPRPITQAQSCNPVELGKKGRHWAGICIKQREPVISDKLACCT